MPRNVSLGRLWRRRGGTGALSDENGAEVSFTLRGDRKPTNLSWIEIEAAAESIEAWARDLLQR